MSIYKDCDIRGKYGEEFDAEEMRLVGRAIGHRLAGGSIVVAGDVRVSTPAIREKLTAGLAEEGAHIIDIGIVPTPVAYFAKSKACFDAYALAIVTASHNPAGYNGIKLMFGDYPPTPAQIKSIEAEVRAYQKESSGAEETGAASGTVPDAGTESGASGSVYESISVVKKYKDYISGLVKGGCGLRAVLDIGNGTTAGIAPELYRSLGYDVVELFGQADGRFPNRNPNPADFKNLDAVRAKVLETGADFGVAFDGDGDRAVFIDNLGRPVINEKALIMLTEHATGRSFEGTEVCDNAEDTVNKTHIAASGAHPEKSILMDAADKTGMPAAAAYQANGAADVESATAQDIRDSLSDGSFSVVYDQKCSRIVPDAISAMGGEAILERSGHAFIKKKFLEHGSIIAGEISGHFFFSELGHDDGIYAGLCMGDFLAGHAAGQDSGTEAGSQISGAAPTLAQLADRLPDPHISPDLRYKVSYAEMDEVLSGLKAHYEELGMQVSTYDGVRVELPGGWLLVRKSVTEEAMTVKIEAQDEAGINEVRQYIEKNYFPDSRHAD